MAWGFGRFGPEAAAAIRRESEKALSLRRRRRATADTIPLALGTALDERRVKAGDTVLLAAVGAGFTVGSVLLRWTGVSWD